MERVQEKDTMMSRYLLKNKALCRNLVKQEKEWIEAARKKNNVIKGLDIYKNGELLEG